MAKNKFTLLQKVLLVLALIMVAFGYQIIWNLMTGAYVEQETCPQGYECTKIVEPEFVGSAWIENGCMKWDGIRGASISFTINGTEIPRCDEVEKKPANLSCHEWPWEQNQNGMYNLSIRYKCDEVQP